MNSRTVAITGATGAMGLSTVKEFIARSPETRLRLLVRKSKTNIKKTADWLKYGNVEIIWGSFSDKEALHSFVKGADIILHMGGLVSPKADYFPELTWETNVNGIQNLINAVVDCGQSQTTAFVYIGSVSQYGPRAVPFHWGGPGDPMLPADFDTYAKSKIAAEHILAESSLKKWVSLRQSGILSTQTLMKGSDPITFHVPINGVLEWATVEDSARLMLAVSGKNVPEEFWCRFWNIGSGESFRLTNYEFESLLLKALGCPPPEKIFNPDWFATRNFHGIWYTDSDELEKHLHFRENIPADKYFRRMKRNLPWFFKLTPIAPSWIIKAAMKHIASHKELGTLSWSKDKNTKRYRSYFGTMPPEHNWEKAVTEVPLKSVENASTISLPFSRSKMPSGITTEDLEATARARGGKCLSPDAYSPGSTKPLEWECGCGHRFTAKAVTVVLGGHWCPECGIEVTGERISTDPMLRKAWATTHPEIKG